MSEGSEAKLLVSTVKGAGWVVGWRMSTRLLGLLSMLILARVLRPTDFGLVALGTGFVQAIDALSSVGVEDAVIREHDPGRDIYDTAFTMNAIRGVTTAALVLMLAYPTGAFFNDARLGTVLLALGSAMVFSAFENIGIVEYRRQFAFDMEFKLLLVPRVAGILAAIGSALAGAGYWALVAGILVTRLLRLGLSYILSPYRPRLQLSAWRYLLGFSVWTWLIGLTRLIGDRLPNFFIGRVFDARHVGLFSLGDEIAALPVTELVSPLCRACYSAFAVGRHTGQDAAKLYLRIVATVFLLTLPAGTGIALLAAPIVRLAVGPQWLGVAPVIQIMAAAGVISSITAVSTTLFNAHALLRSMLGISLAATIARAVLLAALLHGGNFLHAAVAVALATCFESALYLRMMMRRFGIRSRELAARIWRSMAGTVVMCGSLALLPLSRGVMLGEVAGAGGVLGAVGVGASVYTLTVLGLWYSSGRPSGGESDVFLLLRRMAGGSPWAVSRFRRLG